MDRITGPAVSDLSFQLAAAADGIVPHQNWITARENALRAVRGGVKVTAILGPPGVGKTLMLEDLARALKASGFDTWLLPPTEAICGQDCSGVVLIDEDFSRDADTWSQLFQSSSRYVITGLPALADYLQIFANAVEMVFINPLAIDDVGPFITEQLIHSGVSTKFFTPAAIDRLAERTGGVPRTLNLLARSALLLADAENAGSVQPRHIDKIAEKDNDRSRTNREWLRGCNEKEFPLSAAFWGLRWKFIRLGCASIFSGIVENGSDPVTRHSQTGGPSSSPQQSLWQFIQHTATRARTGRVLALALIPFLCFAVLVQSLLSGGAQHPTGIPSSTNAATGRPGMTLLSPASTSATIGAGVGSASIATPSTPPPEIARPPTMTSATPRQADLPVMPPTPAVRRVPAGEHGVVGSTRAYPQTSVSSSALPDAHVSQSGTAALSLQDPAQAVQTAPVSGTADATSSALPAGALIRIVLAYSRGDTRAAEWGWETAQTLRKAGLIAGDPLPSSAPVTKPTLSFFYAQDKDAAEAISRRLDGEFGRAVLKRLRAASALPRPGTIEIAIP